MTEFTKKGIVAGGMGLNAAAIVFLYTHFTPRVEYDHLHEQHQAHVEKYEKLKERVVVQEATLNVMRSYAGREFE